MNFARAVNLKGREMHGGAIAFVFGKIIFGPSGVVFAHEAIAGDFGEDACGGDAETFLVAFDDRCLGDGERGDAKAIDERVRGRRRKLGESSIHRAVSCLENIDFIDDGCLNDANAEMDFSFRVDCVEQSLADFLGESFGIIEALERFGQTRLRPLGRQNCCCCHHGPGQRPTTGFVHAG